MVVHSVEPECLSCPPGDDFHRMDFRNLQNDFLKMFRCLISFLEVENSLALTLQFLNH